MLSIYDVSFKPTQVIYKQFTTKIKATYLVNTLDNMRQVVRAHLPKEHPFKDGSGGKLLSNVFNISVVRHACAQIINHAKWVDLPFVIAR